MFLIRIHYLSWPQSNQFPLKAGDSVVPLFTRLHHLISPGAEMQYNYLKEASKELAVTSFLQLLTECSRGAVHSESMSRTLTHTETQRMDFSEDEQVSLGNLKINLPGRKK